MRDIPISIEVQRNEKWAGNIQLLSLELQIQREANLLDLYVIEIENEPENGLEKV